MGLKALLVNLEKEITIKIPADIAAGTDEVVKVIKKGEQIVKEDFGKWWDDVVAEVKKLEATIPGLTTPVQTVEVSVADAPIVGNIPEGASSLG